MDSQKLLNLLPDHLFERTRIAAYKPAPQSGEYVLYWMHNALRGHENPALDVAIVAAEKLNLPVFVYQELNEHNPYASDRFHTFQLQGSFDVQEELSQRGIGFALHVQRKSSSESYLANLANLSALVVTEEMPVAPWVGTVRDLISESSVPLWCVDTACIVPMRLPGKSFDRAFQYRNATKNLYKDRIGEDWVEKPVNRKPFLPKDLPFNPVDPSGNLACLIKDCRIDHAVGPVPHTVGGSKAGYERWNYFREKKLKQYAWKRNDAALDNVSRMSPYLHYGMVSPMRIAREAAKANAQKYLDELLIWREPAYNFCFYHKNHESLEVLPKWARDTLEEHTLDDRPALLSWETFSRGKMGDELWDVAQQSLLVHGELHNNVRMTWGKEILRWTKDPVTALAMMIDLNHRFALDGRDPASYGGILWCLGLFDRPFKPAQPIFGVVQTRPTQGHARRMNLSAYQKKVNRPLVEHLPRVAVIGAGISGLICARTLGDHGVPVTIFDKAKRPGGRMTTREMEGEITFDHGAQYFTVRDKRFQRYVDSWIQDGIVKEWEGRIAEINNGQVNPKEKHRVRYVGVPKMDSLCSHLAKDCSVQTSAKVIQIEQCEDKWQLVLEKTEITKFYDIVIFALPPAQATQLLPAGELKTQVETVKMNGCWAVMATFPTHLDLSYDGAFVNDSTISWIARNNSKPGRNETECWTVHGSANWTQEHLEEQPDKVSDKLLEEFFRITAIKPQTPTILMSKLWRYAIPTNPLDIESLFDSEQGLGVCGDWCSGSRIEGAFLSGMSVAGQVLQRITKDIPDQK